MIRIRQAGFPAVEAPQWQQGWCSGGGWPVLAWGQESRCGQKSM